MVCSCGIMACFALVGCVDGLFMWYNGPVLPRWLRTEITVPWNLRNSTKISLTYPFLTEFPQKLGVEAGDRDNVCVVLEFYIH